jgi:hypothetical protein
MRYCQLLIAAACFASSCLLPASLPATCCLLRFQLPAACFASSYLLPASLPATCCLLRFQLPASLLRNPACMLAALLLLLRHAAACGCVWLCAAVCWQGARKGGGLPGHLLGGAGHRGPRVRQARGGHRQAPGLLHPGRTGVRQRHTFTQLRSVATQPHATQQHTRMAPHALPDGGGGWSDVPRSPSTAHT